MVSAQKSLSTLLINLIILVSTEIYRGEVLCSIYIYLYLTRVVDSIQTNWQHVKITTTFSMQHVLDMLTLR